MKKECKNCKKIKEVALSGKSEGLCHSCYKKLLWKPELVECKRCSRTLPNHAKGFCAGCYNSIFFLEAVKLHNAKRYHQIDPMIYKKVVEKCVVCDFNKIVEIHHLNHNNQDNSSTNLIGVCPNHHKMIHSKKHQREVFNILEQKGFIVPKSSYKNEDYFNKIR
jgi:hypothetical protein